MTEAEHHQSELELQRMLWLEQCHKMQEKDKIDYEKWLDELEETHDNR